MANLSALRGEKLSTPILVLCSHLSGNGGLVRVSSTIVHIGTAYADLQKGGCALGVILGF